jgi:hypothetical protein
MENQIEATPAADSSEALFAATERRIDVGIASWLDECEASDDEADNVELTFASASQVKLAFGKHKSKTVGDLLRQSKSRDYLRWVLANFEGLYTETRLAMELCLAEYDKAKHARPASKKRKT